MKRSLCLALLIATTCAFAVSPAGAASSRENRRLHQGKITKNEAQHLVLKKFPGARIGRCVLKRAKHHSVWVIDLVPSGGSGPTQVRVDGRSGRITP